MTIIEYIIVILALTPVATLVILYATTRAEVIPAEPRGMIALDERIAIERWWRHDVQIRGMSPPKPTFRGFDDHCLALDLYLRMQMHIPPERVHVDERHLFDLKDCLARLGAEA